MLNKDLKLRKFKKLMGVQGTTECNVGLEGSGEKKEEEREVGGGRGIYTFPVA